MIDWSSSDSIFNGSDLLYVPDIEGGIFFNQNVNLNEHLCYECNDTVGQQVRVNEIINSVQQSVPEESTESFIHKKDNFQQKVSFLSYDNTLEPNKSSSTSINNVFGSSNVLIFILVILFVIYIELRISNLYNKLRIER